MGESPLSIVRRSLDDAVLDAGAWPSAVAAAADAVSAASGAMLSLSHSVGVWSRVAPEARQLFYERFVNNNPIQAGLDRLRRAGVGPGHGVVTDRHLSDRDDFVRSGLFNDFMAPSGVQSMLVVDLHHRDVRGALNVSTARDGFSREELRTMAALRPALSRALWLGVKLGRQDRAVEDLGAVFDRSADALLVVGADGLVRHANPAAEALMRETDGITVSLGRLCAPTSDATGRLRALIAAAADPDGPGGTSAMGVATPGRRLPLSVLVTPLNAQGASAFADLYVGRSVLVCVSDLDAPLALPAQTLRDLFGLTSAEAKVAVALADGRTLQEAADELGLSFFTVRAHMAHVFQKTDTHRQAELVRLVLRATRALDS